LLSFPPGVRAAAAGGGTLVVMNNTLVPPSDVMTVKLPRELVEQVRTITSAR
jgi:dihydroorotase-like cyclic amidohydrolase